MAPTSSLLQGLNVVQPKQQPSGLSDAQDLLQSPPFSQDLAAQLELWSSVHFAQDEPFFAAADHQRQNDAVNSSFDDENESQLKSASPASVSLDRSVKSSSSLVDSLSHPYENFFSNFHNSVDPFRASPSFDTNALFGGASPSEVASESNEKSDPSSQHFGVPLAIDPALASLMDPIHSLQQSSRTKAAPKSPPTLGPAYKKARTGASSRKNLTAATMAPSSSSSSTNGPKSTTTTKSTTATLMDNEAVDDDDDDEVEKSSPGGEGVVTAAEDKRRRNTAASARFRLKKKEREQAMEKKAKNLETRVGELERECEALRRENGWLKGLVVGVTGGGAASLHALPPSSPSVSTLTPAKRGLEE